MKQLQLFLRSRAKSFGFAFQGLAVFFRREPNTWIHLALTIVVLTGIVFFRLSAQETIALLMVTGFVWVAEIFNTAIERAMDFVSPAKHPAIKVIKDLSASGVLVAAITALLTGAIIFIPKFF